ILVLVILVIPPLFWFYVSWKATGNWRACFQARQQYHDWLLAANPTLVHLSLSRVVRDGAMLLVSTDIAVLVAAFVAGWFVLKRVLPRIRNRDSSRDIFAILPPIVFFFAFFLLIVVAYLTGTQPIIFPRYGLIMFTLGIPILAWLYLEIRRRKP